MSAARAFACAVLAVIATALAVPALAADPAEGDLRLRGGGARHKGRLQIYHDDRWGAVCDDAFRHDEADVACRQLGYQGADGYYSYTNWSSSFPYWLDDVDCDGTEDTLTQCSSTGWGLHNCSPAEHVGLRCTVASADPEVQFDLARFGVDEGSTAGYAVRLGKEPTGEVTVTVTVSGTSATDLSVRPSSLTFTTGNWSRRQTVTVRAADDIDVGDDLGTLTHSASGGGYGSRPVRAVEVRVEDKDVVVVPTPSAISVNEDGTAGYELHTDGGPWDSLTVAVEVPPDSGFRVRPATVTFTRSDWDTPRSIAVIGREDGNWVDNTWTVAHSAQGSGPGAVPAGSVAVTVEDLGPLGAWIDDGGIISLAEGGSASYRIRLDRDPGATATVTMQAPSKLSVAPSSLSFDASNWSRSRLVTIEALQDDDSVDENVRVRHRVAQAGLEASLDSTLVRITDDDDGEGLIGSRPEAANVWWAALTSEAETGGVVGHINYREPFADTGKLSEDTFTYDGIGREVDAVYLDRTGHFQIWVDSGNGSALPNDLVLHVGSASMTLGSATQQSFGTTCTERMAPMVREHTYWWQAGAHSVTLSSGQATAVWLADPEGDGDLPDMPRSVEAMPGDGKVDLKWVPPVDKPSGSVLGYELQQEGTEGWTSTDGTDTTEEVKDLVNGESYKFRVRAVSAQGKGAASAPGLTGEFVSVPASHDGSAEFTLRLEISDEIARRFRRKRRSPPDAGGRGG